MDDDIVVVNKPASIPVSGLKDRHLVTNRSFFFICFIYHFPHHSSRKLKKTQKQKFSFCVTLLLLLLLFLHILSVYIPLKTKPTDCAKKRDGKQKNEKLT
jgi:hypothetical protein